MHLLEITQILICTLLSQVAAVNTTVQLSYATYRGSADANGISQWLGMRYAAAPIGNLRFAAPQDPPHVSGVLSATKYGKHCLAVDDKPPVNTNTSEDCLFLDVYAPTYAKNDSKLPVFFFIQGGGFASNANADFNGRGLVAASGNNIVVVTSNYRVGPYGFLAGSEVDSPNNGFKDQRKALEWVQAHIATFGGDPKHVVIGGDSAGAASVTLHLTANGGRDDHLFHAAAAESQSFAVVLSVEETEYQYKGFVIRTGCASSKDTLACLRSKTSNELQYNNTAIPYPGALEKPLYSWNPVIDGSLIQDYTYRAFNSGAFIKVPVIFGDDTNGGTIFVPKSTWTQGDSNAFLYDQFPYLTLDQIQKLNELYPNPNVTFPDSGPWWRQAANVYGDMRYMCPGLFLSGAYTKYNVSASYNYRYNVEDPAQIASGLGVPHTVEVNAIFGPGNVGTATPPASYETSGSNAGIVPLIQGYWTSFIRSFDPNPYRMNGSAVWEKWTTADMNRLLFATPPNATAMEKVEAGQWARCEYLWSIGVANKQ